MQKRTSPETASRNLKIGAAMIAISPIAVLVSAMLSLLVSTDPSATAPLFLLSCGVLMCLSGCAFTLVSAKAAKASHA